MVRIRPPFIRWEKGTGGKQILCDSLFSHSLYNIYNDVARGKHVADEDSMSHDIRQFMRTVCTIAFVDAAAPYINF
jgi:hypothetical protein